MSNDAKSGARWWELYAVRYAMATLVGAVVFYILCSSSSSLKPLTTRWEYLGGVGLVYCYLASAPILVLHSGRFTLRWNGFKRLRWGFVPPIVSLLAGVAVWLFLPRPTMDFLAYFVYLVAVVIGVFVFCLQVVIVGRVLHDSDALWTFYKGLSERRAHLDTGEIVDSYRQLREHGNSLFIVFLEIVLGVILVGTSFVVGGRQAVPSHMSAATPSIAAAAPDTIVLDSRFIPLLVILALWTLPGVLVWYVATVFERKFSEQPDSGSAGAVQQ